MPAKTGSYSRFMFDRAKQYIYPLVQQGKAVIDADVNDWFQILTDLITHMMRDLTGGYSESGVFANITTSPYGLVESFDIQESSATTSNNFIVSPGSGYIEDHPLILEGETNDIEYLPDADSIGVTQGRTNLHSIVTYVDYNVANPGYTTVRDTAMKWPNDAHNSREFVPDISDTSTSFTIQDTLNDNEILLSGDQTASITAGQPYLIKISTPGSERTDQVWLNTYYDEIDSDEDPDLLHDIKGGYEACLRMKCRTIIEVEENTGGSPQFSSDYVDDDGNQHYRIKLAEITRSVAAITTATITDQRVTLTPLTHNLGDHVDVSADEAAAFNGMKNPNSSLWGSNTNYILCQDDAVLTAPPRLGVEYGEINSGWVRDNSEIRIPAGLWVPVFNQPLRHMPGYDSGLGTTQGYTQWGIARTEADMTMDLTVNGQGPLKGDGTDPFGQTADAWCHLYIIMKLDGTVSAVASLNAYTISAGSGLGLDDYILYRRVGCFYYDWSVGNCYPASQIGDTIIFDEARILGTQTMLTNPSVNYWVSLSAGCPSYVTNMAYVYARRTAPSTPVDLGATCNLWINTSNTGGDWVVNGRYLHNNGCRWSPLYTWAATPYVNLRQTTAYTGDDVAYEYGVKGIKITF